MFVFLLWRRALKSAHKAAKHLLELLILLQLIAKRKREFPSVIFGAVAPRLAFTPRRPRHPAGVQ